MIYDVVILGAGVVGGMAAYQLSQYKLTLAVVEAKAEAGMGASCANSGIVHAGYDAEEGTKKAKLNVQGNAMMSDLCKTLDVPFRRNGSMVVAFNEDEMAVLLKLLARGKANSVPDLTMLTPEQVHQKEPYLNKVCGALYAPSAGIVSPFELAIAAVETAQLNGTDVFFNTTVRSLTEQEDYVLVDCGEKQLKARFVLNCTGVWSDTLAGDETFVIHPRKGEYLLLDKKCSGLVQHTIFPTPSAAGKGVLIVPTVHGNILLGPTADDTEDRKDTGTTAAGMESILIKCQKYISDLSTKNVITSFAGLRASSTSKDFIIKFAPNSRRRINAAGIESPGLTASPAIALLLEKMLADAGVVLEKKHNFQQRPRVVKPAEMSFDEKNEWIKQNPAYGRIVCRCEQISEGEILDAIARGAVTVDGIKRRVRAGMGRCQGSFCLPTVLKMLAEEGKIDCTEVTKCGGGSVYIKGTNR